ncbi:MAG: bifunctional UDP-N-acetylglucosamine diphosphorylase/glucosamine-1-phosphate N-acetyltransferase GlmU [Actinomycetota bacterium]
MGDETGRVVAVVLAAGEGKRLKSDLPKVLHRAAGRPLLAHALDAVRSAGLKRPLVVASARRSEIDAAMQAAGHADLDCVVQDPPRGTGDAVRVALEAVPPNTAAVLVINGDAPLLRGATLQAMIEERSRSGAAAILLTTIAPEDLDSGKVIRDAAGAVDRIVEAKDASDEELAVQEINAGAYLFDVEPLRTMVGRLDSGNAQGEYYLTDVIALLRQEGLAVSAHLVGLDETLGVNDRAQLAEASRVLRCRVADHWMSQGVSIIDPASTFIDVSVTIGAEAVIHPFTFLEGKTAIGSRAEIGPQARIIDSDIGESATVSFSVVRGSDIGPETSVGPFASLRPGTKLARGARLGTFVESKNTTLGQDSKANHLAYLGDAEIGEGVNVGAGTITTNWDGESKHKTVIEDDAYIGSDTMLVAPVRIGKRAATGAGAVVRDDVPDDALAVGVPARNIPGKGDKMGKGKDG